MRIKKLNISILFLGFSLLFLQIATRASGQEKKLAASAENPNLIKDGQFKEIDLTNWWLFKANEPATDAHVSVENGRCLISSIALPEEQAHWKIQLGQTLSEDSKNKLVNGDTYTLQFEAHAVFERDCRIFLGENEGSFRAYMDQVIQISRKPATYTYEVEISQVFNSVQLTFGLGADSTAVMIDNVILQKKVDGNAISKLPFLKWEARYDGTVGKGTANVFTYDDIAQVAVTDALGNIYVEGISRRNYTESPSPLFVAYNTSGDEIASKAINKGYLNEYQINDANYFAIKSEYNGESTIHITKSGSGGWTVELEHPLQNGQTPADDPVDLVVDDQGDLYLLGIYQTDDAFLNREGVSRWILVKLSGTDGSEFWRDYSTNTSSSVSPYSLILDAGNNVLVAASNGTYKYDRWGQDICSINKPFLRDDKISADAQGNIYIASLTNSVGNDPNTYSQYTHKDVQITKYSSMCSELWTTKFEQHYDDRISKLLVINNAVYSLIENEDAPEYSNIPPSSLVKISDQGILEWSAGMEEGNSKDLVDDLDEFIYVATSYLIENSYQVDPSAIYKFDAVNGTRIWREEITNQTFAPVAIMLDQDRDIVIAGSANSIDHLQPNQLNDDILVLKYIQAEDMDQDGIPNTEDNCPFNWNPDQEDGDEDGTGDVCDNCVSVSNPGQADSDLGWNGQASPDAYGDACDNCPDTPNMLQEDGDDDGVGDDCDNCEYLSNSEQTDGDNDGVGNECDNCESTYNPDQINSDDDEFGDACDEDDDNDGIPDISDNCPTVVNLEQNDLDGDGIGDECNDHIDRDGDDWANNLDNCPDRHNPLQTDNNNNGIGDSCEVDLKVVRVEITQAIQDERNSVPLVYGKDTWVRVYFDVGMAQQPIDSIRGMIRFEYENGNPMYTYINQVASADLLHCDNVITAMPKKGFDAIDPNLGFDATNPGHTLNFRIPGNWRWDDDPYLEIIVLYGGPDVNPTNNSPQRQKLEFHHVDLNVTMVPVFGGHPLSIVMDDCKAPTDNTFRTISKWVKKVYPISKLNLYKTSSHFFALDPTDNVIFASFLMHDIWWINVLTDDPLNNMKYYGLMCKELKPCESVLTCDGPASGMGWGDESWGIRNGYWGTVDETLGGENLAHELGHTILGNQGFGKWYQILPAHVPDNCENHRAPFFETYPRSYKKGKIDAHGFDGTYVYDKDLYYDLMSYAPCKGSYGLGNWISTYIYKLLFKELYDDSKKGSKKEAQVKNQCTAITGIIVNDESIESVKCHQIPLISENYSETGVGNYTLELQNSSGVALFIRHFSARYQSQATSVSKDVLASFSEILPYFQETKWIVFKLEDQVLGMIEVSPHIPQVEITYPNSGELLKEMETLTWTASDEDGDSLVFEVLYSRDGGSSWKAIATGLKDKIFDWDVSNEAGGAQGLIRVLASDGANTGEDISDAMFAIEEKVPEISILSPLQEEGFFRNRTIIFEGAGYDPEDGPLPDSAFSWVSDTDGALAEGYHISVDNLSPGAHIITLSAKDSDGNLATDWIAITVNADQDTDGDGIGDLLDQEPFKDNSVSSTPATACIPEVDEDPDNLLVNGSFGNCELSPWELYLNTSDGAQASTSISNGLFSLSDITLSADTIPRDIRLQQPFSPEQLERLEPGNTYSLSFSADAGTENRPIKITIGLNEAPWTLLLENEELLTTTYSRYTYQFEYPAQHSSFRLAFDFGTDNIPVTIDNVRLFKKTNTSLDKKIASSFTIYPNPAHNFVRIEMKSTDQESPVSIQLFDLAGVQHFVTTTPLNSNYTLDLSSFPPGMYVMLIGQKGQQTSKKLIVY